MVRAGQFVNKEGDTMNVVKIDAKTRKELRSSMDYLARVEERADAEGEITIAKIFKNF